jgi:hypothetical protein
VKGLAGREGRPCTTGGQRDLVGAVGSEVDDHDLVILLTNPDGLADVVIRDRVPATVEGDDRLDLAHATRDAEGSRIRFGWQRMQPLAFVRQPFERRAARDAVRARIHPLTECTAGTPILDEARVLGQQIGVGRHQIRGRDAHGCLRPILRLGVTWHTAGNVRP